ncbi:MAG: DMT family transporter [Planctomycetes bacterium]|nr:DMT family transporter [Planctomycetota bacterium]
MLTLACVVWGLSFVFIKDVDRSLDRDDGWSWSTAAAWIVAVRFLAAFALLAAWPGVLRGFTRPICRDGLLLAIPSVLGYGLQAAGMRGLEPGTNAFLTSLYTPLTPLLAWLVFRKMVPLRVLLAVPAALAGVAVLTSDGQGGWLSAFGLHEGLVVAGAICWAVQILLIDRFGRRHGAGPFAASLFLWTGLLALGALACLRGGASAGELLAPLVRPALGVPIGGLVLLSTIFTLVVLIRFQPALDPSRAALLYLMEPAFAAVFSYFLEGEGFGGRKLAGCLVLLAANAVVEIRWRR